VTGTWLNYATNSEC